jgi:hypothetical protein
MYNKSNPSPYAVSQVEELAGLKELAEEFIKLSTPDNSQNFLNWRSNIEMFIQRNCGGISHEWSRYSSIVIFPEWFDAENHGSHLDKIDRPIAEVASDLISRERKTALKIFRSGLSQIIALLQSMIVHLQSTGIPFRPIEKDSLSSSPLISNTVNQTQGQSQSQSQEQNISIEQQIEQILNIIENKYGEEQTLEAKKMLEELKKDSKWPTVQKVGRWFLDLGRDAFIALLPLLVKIIKNH